MGVPGLWQLLEAAKRSVDLEQLRGKRVAIDINIWLHQTLKSRGSEGSNNPNFFLSILFRRLCKLLFFGIRPVFVFDGTVPQLKKIAMATRRESRENLRLKSQRARERLLKRLFLRLAQSGISKKSPSKDLATEVARHLNSTVDARRAQLDAEMFGSQSTSQPPVSAAEISSKTLELELEHKESSELARDFLNNYPGDPGSIDFQSEIFTVLPWQAQLQVVALLQGNLSAIPDDASLVGEAFSLAQVNKLLLNREFSQKRRQIERKMNEEMVSSVVTPHLTQDLLGVGGDSGQIDMTALRIASQDEGHAILMKKRTSRTQQDSPSNDLQRLISPPKKGENVTAPSPEKSPEIKKETAFQEADPFQGEIHDYLARSTQLTNATEEEDYGDDDFPLKRFKPEISDLKSPPQEYLPSENEMSEGELVDASVSLKNERNEDICPFKREDCASFDDLEDVQPIVTAASFSNFSQNEYFEKRAEILLPPSTKDETVSKDDIESSDDFEDVPPLETTVIPALPESVKCCHRQSDGDSNSLEDLASAAQRSANEDAFDDDNGFEFDDDFLRAEVEKLERLAQQTTTDIQGEAQRLVRLFGFPVVLSPEEAEAQCCHLQTLGLVDVVASDDSDVWLFGAHSVCRHLFGGVSRQKEKNKDRHGPISYCLRDIFDSLGLDRTQLLRFALLCGSDYTPGINKIGPVTAMEILAEFSIAESVTTTPQPFPVEERALRKHASLILQPLIDFKISAGQQNSRWKSLKIPADFPNQTVIEGYLFPKVDSEKSAFQWNSPDVHGIAQFAVDKFGWSKASSESMLSSVMGVTTTPLITDFFASNPVKPTSSKGVSRLSTAITRLRYASELNSLPDLEDEWPADPTFGKASEKQTRSRRSKPPGERQNHSNDRKRDTRIGTKRK